MEPTSITPNRNSHDGARSNRVFAHKYGIRGKRKYYMFRNVNRIKSIKRWGILTGVMSVLSVIAVIAAGGSLALWAILIFFTAMFSFGNTGFISKFQPFLNFSLAMIIVAVGLVVVSILVRYLIEYFYIAAERVELSRDKEGSEKYLKIMKASMKVKMINLLILIPIAVAAVLIWRQVGGTAGIVGLAVGIIAILIVAAIFKRRIFRKVEPEMLEVSEERRAAGILGV